MFKATKNKYHIQSIKRMNWQARQLRYQPTPAEHMLWQKLRKKQLLGFKFRRQHAIYRYIADFVCDERGLIIEVDGGIHAHQERYDKNRDAFLQSLGYTVVHFTNGEVLFDIEGVLQHITSLLQGGGALSDPAVGGRVEGRRRFNEEGY